MYVTQVWLTGQWLGLSGTLRVRAAHTGVNSTTELANAKFAMRLGDGPWTPPDAIPGSVVLNEAAVGLDGKVTLAGLRAPSRLKVQDSQEGMFMVKFGGGEIRVMQKYPGKPYLDVDILYPSQLKTFDLGGLLGMDPHSHATKERDECRTTKEMPSAGDALIGLQEPPSSVDGSVMRLAVA